VAWCHTPATTADRPPALEPPQGPAPPMTPAMALLEPARLILLALLVLAVEAILLLGLRRRRRDLPLTGLLANLVAGSCLLLALWLGQLGANGAGIALLLAGSLVAHLLDLRQRLQVRRADHRQARND
jgi:hypothetical protein